MTRKHYIKFADAISKISDAEERASVAQTVALVCAEDNPRFDSAKFYAACNVK